jgi:hypothetical protein
VVQKLGAGHKKPGFEFPGLERSGVQLEIKNAILGFKIMAVYSRIVEYRSVETFCTFVYSPQN